MLVNGKVILSNYKIFETDEFKKRFKKLELYDQQFLRIKLYKLIYPTLKQNPDFGINIKKLKGYNPDTWRCRVGKYRIFYSIDKDGETVFILSVDNRKDAYKRR